MLRKEQEARLLQFGNNKMENFKHDKLYSSVIVNYTINDGNGTISIQWFKFLTNSMIKDL